MVKYSDILEVFITATLISFLASPLMMMIAAKTGYLDHPKDNKRHAHATPLLGGMSIFLAFTIGLFSQWDVIGSFSMSERIVAMMSGVAVLLILGLIDDKFGMEPNIKLLGQFLAAMILYKSGTRITFLGNYYLNLIVTYLWVIGVTNSFNLLDNMNGLSAGIAVVASFFFGVISWMNGQGMVSMISFCLCGGCLGFLKHNFPRARIFMGDSGSLIIGYVLASIAMMGSWRSNGLWTSLAVPILVLAYPIFDTTLVTVIRLIEGRSVFQGGRDHSSHRLALLNLKARRAVLVIYAVCCLLGISAVLVSMMPFEVSELIIVATVVGLSAFGVRLALVRTGRFGRRKTLTDEMEE